jgi:hypothetical protein
LIRTAALIVVVLAIGAVAGCGEETLDATSSEESIKSSFESSTGQTVDSVSCPEDLSAEVGTEFDCTIESGGESTETTWEITSIEGDTANFELVSGGTTGAAGDQ